MKDINAIDVAAFDAWLFDLDGVITDTASDHAAAWKRMFDAFLRGVATRVDEPFQPFEIDPDYFEYVDGKPRYHGVDSFLRSRGIELDWGGPDDSPDTETVCGLGNRKNRMFNEVLEAEGCDVFASSVALVRQLKSDGKGVAVVTASENCDAVLAAAGIPDLFDAMVDGVVADERSLRGKPNPDTYEEAARLLDTEVDRSVVIEDAISGVEAGRTGGFGLVIGVARHVRPETLETRGADIVVRDLGELAIERTRDIGGSV